MRNFINKILLKCGYTPTKILNSYIKLKNKNKTYIIKPESKFEEQQKIEIDGIKIYGWTIESKLKDGGWHNYKNKIYGYGTGMEAINQIYHGGAYQNYEHRLVPLYKIDQSAYRNLTINKILNDENEK